MKTKKKTAGKTATKKVDNKKKETKKSEPLRPAETLKKKKEEKQAQQRDTKTYNFNGEKLGKGPFVLALVKDYVKKHPKASLTDIKKGISRQCHAEVWSDRGSCTRS